MKPLNAEKVWQTGLTRPGNRKKNTRKWCRGRKGVEHQWGEPYRLWPNITIAEFWEKRCKLCGKKNLWTKDLPPEKWVRLEPGQVHA